MLSHSIHVGLAPNKSKIKNSWKCINGFRHAIHRMLRILFHGRLAPYKSAKINALTSKLAGRYFY